MRTTKGKDLRAQIDQLRQASEGQLIRQCASPSLNDPIIGVGVDRRVQAPTEVVRARDDGVYPKKTSIYTIERCP
jgi:hypothetical protein